MIIEVWVHPGSSQKKIVEKDGIFHVYIHKQPEKGKANADCIAILSKHFKAKKSDITIKSGHTNRKKKIEIPDLSK